MEDLGIGKLFNDTYRNKHVLITGHTGFKGSWLATWLLSMGARVSGFSLPALTTPSHFANLHLAVDHHHGDLRDPQAVHNVIQNCRPDIVFHLAAQALVRESYRDPETTYHTNVLGTLNLLEAIRKCDSVKAVVNVTTDKVYENREWAWPYRETDHLGGYDLYSSSKACSEILTASYRNSFFNLNQYKKSHHVLVAAARAGNVIGGGDWAAERLIPDVVRATASGHALAIRSPDAIRPWEHVLEPLSGYLLLGQKLLEGDTSAAAAFNFGPDTQHALPVRHVLDRFKQHWPELQWEDRSNPAEPYHEAGVLKLDCSLASNVLQWRPVWSLDETLQVTAQWYHDFYRHQKINTHQDLRRYVMRARELNLTWTAS